MTDEFLDSIEEIFQDMGNEKHMDHLYNIWLKLDENRDFGTFEAFTVGNFAGALIFLYSSYKGKKISNLSEKEIKNLNRRILGYCNDLKPMINNYVAKLE